MTRALSQDLRDRVVAAMRQGATCREAAKTFSVSVASAVRWSQLARATGSTAPRPHGARRRLVTKHAVKQVDRLMSNAGIDVWDSFTRWVPQQVGSQRDFLVAMDWTSAQSVFSRR